MKFLVMWRLNLASPQKEMMHAVLRMPDYTRKVNPAAEPQAGRRAVDPGAPWRRAPADGVPRRARRPPPASRPRPGS